MVGFYPGLGAVDGVRAGGDEPGGGLVSFHPVLGGDMAWGQTWAGFVGSYTGLGEVDGVRAELGGHVARRRWAVTWHGGVRADVGDDVAPGLVGFYAGWGNDLAQAAAFARAGTKAAGLGAVRADLGGDVAPGMGCNGWVGSSAGVGIVRGRMELTWGPSLVCFPRHGFNSRMLHFFLNTYI